MLAMWAVAEKVAAAVDVAAPDAFACAVAILGAALTGACAASFCFFFGDICDIQLPRRPCVDMQLAIGDNLLRQCDGAGGGGGGGLPVACTLWLYLL